MMTSTNNPDIEPVIKPDSKPVNPATYQAKTACDPVKLQTQEPVSCPSNGPDIKSTESPVIEPVIYVADASTNQPAKLIVPEMWYPFTERQGRVLMYLIEAGGQTKRDDISRATGVNIATVKYALRVFVKDGFISPTNLAVNHTQRGFSYQLNPHLCNEYAARFNGPQYVPVIQPSNDPVSYPANASFFKPAQRSVNQPGNRPDATFSSRSVLEEKLTTSEDLLRDPELGYWKEKGVTNRQIDKWAEEFGMETAMVLQSLKNCRFEMIALNHEEERQIANPMNWFYRVMQRSGFYPRPAAYKSMAELRAEQMEQAVRELIEARERQAAAEAELAFQKILADTLGDEYQSLLSQVGSFATDMGGKALETALREAFLKARG